MKIVLELTNGELALLAKIHQEVRAVNQLTSDPYVEVVEANPDLGDSPYHAVRNLLFKVEAACEDVPDIE